MIADCWRPSGYFVTSFFAQARLSLLKAKSFGCISGGARRRTLIEPLRTQTPRCLSSPALCWASTSLPLQRKTWMAGTSPAMTGKCNATSSVDLPEHNVDRAEDGGNVGEHVAAREEIHRLQVREARRADLALVRLVGAVSDQIDAELTLRRLDSGVNFAGRPTIALGIQLEVMDERFHRAFHLVAFWRDNLVVADSDRSLPGGRTQFLAALLHDFDRLTHLLHADEIAVEAVAVFSDRDVELELGITLVRLRLAQIPRSARPAHHHTREPPVPAVGKLDDADVDIALFENAVAGEQRVEVVDNFQERIAPRIDVVDEL